MKKAGLIVVMICGCILVAHAVYLPPWSGPEVPAARHVSPYYIEHSLEDTAVPNIITSVLADYRGYDTLFETTVIFAAGLACYFLLRIPGRETRDYTYFRHIPTGLTIRVEQGGKIPRDSMIFKKIDSIWIPEDIIIKITCRLLIPFIQLFGLYVVAHGHYSPGGGFQGGVILGATLILFALSHDLRATTDRISEKLIGIFSGTGVLIYAGTGTLCLVLGGYYLDYSKLALLFGTNPVMARSHGIMIVEIGVALAVSAVMLWIYTNLSSVGRHDEGL